MVVNKLRKVGGLIKRAKEDIMKESVPNYGAAIVCQLVDQSNYFAPGGGFWSTELGQWLANVSKGTIFEGGSYSEPYVAALYTLGFATLGTYLLGRNGKYAKIADEWERALDEASKMNLNPDKMIDHIVEKYGKNEWELRKIAKYMSPEYEEKIMKRYKEMKEEELDKIEDEKERLNYIWDNYNRKVKWWEFAVPFYGLYAAAKEYKAEKELYKEIAEKVESGKISDDAVAERFGKRKADRIMRKYGKEGARKGERAGIFSRITKGISGMWGSISEGLKGYFIKSAEDGASGSDNSEGRKTVTGVKKRSAVRGILRRIGGVRGISERFKNYFSRRSEKPEGPIDTSDYLDLTDEELYTVE